LLVFKPTFKASGSVIVLGGFGFAGVQYLKGENQGSVEIA
jgi:hypothetical protein